MKHINDIEKDTNMLSLRKVCLRKLINLTYLMTDYTKFVQQIVKYRQVDMDLFNMIIDCCCEHSTYENHFGNLTKVKIKLRYGHFLKSNLCVLVIFKGF